MWRIWPKLLEHKILSLNTKMALNGGNDLSFAKFFPVAHAVEEELDRFKTRLLRPKTEKSDWTAPIITVPKADQTIWICSDYKRKPVARRGNMSINKCFRFVFLLLQKET